jgi:hypothetical protein
MGKIRVAFQHTVGNFQAAFNLLWSKSQTCQCITHATNRAKSEDKDEGKTEGKPLAHPAELMLGDGE